MSDEWLTYEEVAVRLGVTPRAARARAFRGRWSKTMGNDGRARVRLTDERPAPARNTTVRPTDPVLVDALREHNAGLKTENERLAAALETLKAQLAAAEARVSEEAAKRGQAINAIEAHNSTLKAQLANAEDRADAEAAKCAEVIRASAAQFAVERERADRSIRAFESLAERLEAMAEAKRPSWRRWLRFAD